MNIIPPSFNFSNRSNNSENVISGTSFSGHSLTEKTLEETIIYNIKTLESKGDTLIVDLDHEELENFDEIVEFMRSKSSNLDNVKKVIKKSFKRKSYTAGTVSKFFMECFDSNHVKEFDLACSGSAAKAGKTSCNDLVLACENNNLLKLNNLNYTKHVYIYMKDSNLLNETNFNKLKSSGVNEVTFIFNDDTEKKIQLTKSEKNPCFSILLFLIFLFIIIALGYILYVNKNKFMTPTTVSWNNVFV